MYCSLKLDTFGAIVSCFGCLSSQAASTTESSPYDYEHASNLCAKLGKPTKPTKVPSDLVREPAIPFDQFVPSLSALPVVMPKQASSLPLNLAELGDLFDKIDESLSSFGISYVICGLAVMISYGVKGHGANTVSVLVPAGSKDTVCSWALGNVNMICEKRSTDGVDIHMKSNLTRSIKLRWVDDAAFRKFGIIKSHVGSRGARVLNLASFLEQAASAFMMECRGGNLPTASSKIEAIAQDILWVLDCAVSRGIQLEVGYLEVFLNPAFWGLYYGYMGVRTQHAAVLCTKANLPVAEALEEAARLSVVRQHDALLNQYGAQPMLGTAGQQPEPSQGIKTLRRAAVHDMFISKSERSESVGAASNAGKLPVKLLDGPEKPSSRGMASLYKGIRSTAPIRSSNVGRARTERQVGTSMDLVSAQTGRPDGWI